MPKASEQARQLWPYLQPLVQKAVRGIVLSPAGGGGGGLVFSHALSGEHHTGTLADSQAPQFLLRSGARSLTGHLAVDPGMTIDGVDLSAHVADPDAHHARATAGDGIGVASQVVSLRRASPDSGLAIGIDGGAMLGTPTAISAISVNGVSGMSHAHAVISSSDVGTTPPGVNRLLHSTNTGHLVLGSLAVKGSVDITNYGDLTVGNNVLFVMNLPDEISGANNSRVGIMRAPDPQFALDVNGPIRGTELVGKHAIQLDDVAILLHFDGGHPYETNFSGEVNAIPLGQSPANSVAARRIHFRPGKFYKSLVLSRGATNLATNPSFETNLSSWNVTSGGGDMAMTRVGEDFYYGLYSARLTWTTTGRSFWSELVASASGGHYSTGVWMRANVPTLVNLQIREASTTFFVYGEESVLVGEEWSYYTVSTASAPAPGTSLRFIVIPQEDGENALYVDGVMMEASTYSRPYIDGSMGSYEGFAWTGTPHNSTSTSNVGWLSYWLTSMVRHRWTMMGWFCLPYDGYSSDTCGVLSMGSEGNNRSVEVYTGPSGPLCRIIHDGGTYWVTLPDTDVVAGAWNHIAVTYTPGKVSVYWNGLLLEDVTCTMSQIMTELRVGVVGTSSYGACMVDDVVVSRQALNANRVRAIFDSDAQVFAESSVFNFRSTPKGLVWADERGLWVRNVLGDAVFGVYGGDAETHSWGGITLERNDLLIGRSPHGYLHWDDSAQTLTLVGQMTILNQDAINYGNLSGTPNTLSDINGGEGSKLSGIQSGATNGANWNTNVSNRPTNLADINGSEGSKLAGIESGATNGATWNTNLSGRPTYLTDNRVPNGLNASGDVIRRVLPGTNIGTPGGAGLYLGADKMGYFASGAWRTFMDNNGHFFFYGSSGGHLAWDGIDLYGSNGSVVQWYARATTGVLYAGGGVVSLGAAGLSTLVSTDAYPAPGGVFTPNHPHAVKMLSPGGEVIGFLNSYRGALVSGSTRYQWVTEITGLAATVPSGHPGVAELQLWAINPNIAYIPGQGPPNITLQVGYSGLTHRIFFNNAELWINAPASEVSGSSLGSYARKLQVRVNGDPYWIGLYN